jgi:hypothetical protein
MCFNHFPCHRILTSFQLPSECRESPSYRFTIEHVNVLLDVLETHHLTFPLTLGGEGELWRDVNDQIFACLSRAGIVMAPSPSLGDEFLSSPTVLISPHSSRRGRRHLFKHTGLVADAFTLVRLTNISRLVNNPRDHDNRLLLFFGMSCAVSISATSNVTADPQHPVSVTSVARLEVAHLRILVFPGRFG